MSASSPPTHLRLNFLHLYWDIFWYGVLAGSTIAFLNVYAARLGATSLQIGLLTAGPAVTNLIVSLPAGRWLEQRSRIRVSFSSSVWQRAGYVVLIVLPWLLPAGGQVWALQLIILLISVPGTLLAIAFNAMFAEIVPSEWRGQVVGRRNALLALSITGTSLLCGQLLDRIAFPLNYQVVFCLGVVGAALSSYHLDRLRAVPSFRPPPARTEKAKPLLRLDLLKGPFGSLLAAYLLFYTFQHVPLPLFPLAWVRELHLSDGAISLGNALFYVSMLLASTRVGQASARWGHHRVLILGALTYCVYPLFTGLARDAGLFWVASVTGGFAWAFASAGLINRLMERVPPDDLPAHMALHNLALNLGILGGSLVGPVLGNWLGLRQALLIAAGLRVLSSVLLGLWG
jgi:MFS family permease